MRPTDDQRGETLGRVCGQGETNPPAHRVAQEVGRGHGEVVEHREEVCDMKLVRIRVGLMGLVTGAVAPCIHHNEPVVVSQRFDIPQFVPAL